MLTEQTGYKLDVLIRKVYGILIFGDKIGKFGEVQVKNCLEVKAKYPKPI